MILFPTAKINIGLRITGIRDDGFHNIESVLYPVPLWDVVEFSDSGKFSLQLYGRNIPGRPEDNILMKAWELLHRRFSVPEVSVALLKNIPPGSGLGGGSSDAAFFLKGMNDYFQLQLPMKVLVDLALQLGSDVPFFLSNKPVLVTGRGQYQVPVSLHLAGYWLLLVWPRIVLSTTEMFAGVKINPAGASLMQGLQLPTEQWGTVFRNDFEELAFTKYPVLKKIKEQLLHSGAAFASMTGSGSALYGLFQHKPDASLFEKWGTVYLLRIP